MKNEKCSTAKTVFHFIFAFTGALFCSFYSPIWNSSEHNAIDINALFFVSAILATMSLIVGILSIKRKNKGLLKIISNISFVGSSILLPLVIIITIFTIQEILGIPIFPPQD
ncbi:MAG TPA: hypothetical protein GX710_01075 [Clostridiales bacterium]|nr:hypothetical protein [Clostridiales bacterium]